MDSENKVEWTRKVQREKYLAEGQMHFHTLTYSMFYREVV